MAVKLNKHDLEFILKQIKIAEAHSSGIPLHEVRVDANGVYGANGQLAISQPHLPYGLRTVDGTYNNIIPGRELWGAADQTMPRMFDPYWRNETDGDSFDTTGPSDGLAGTVTDGNYNSGGASGNIADADPRIISNLIADQTPSNPAALTAALRHAGHEGNLTAQMASVTAPFALLQALHIADSRVASWEKMLADVNAAIAAAELAGQSTAHLTPLLPMINASLATAQGAAATALAAAEAYSIPGEDENGNPVTITGAQNALDYVAAQLGIEFEVDGRSLRIPNVAPDEGLSAPFNGWMTFFGQFFDHGLDLISKGGDGTIYVPLQPDDPLYVPDGFTNFMVLTRATQIDGPGPDGIMGTDDDTRDAVNVTTPFVDQNQTYTSHPSHQVFLREYEVVDGKPLATGRMLDGINGGLPTWKDVKEQARTKLGIELSDKDVFSIPLIRTDLYGEFVRDANGMPQLIVGLGPDGIPNTDDDVLVSGNLASPIKLKLLSDPASLEGITPVRTSHSFLDDIAHNAVPIIDQDGILVVDNVVIEDIDPAGNAVQFNPLTGRNTEYDNELLDAHFITGDGRGNENIGLTAVHHVFHSEHNRQVETNKKNIVEMVQSGEADIAFLNEWLLDDVTELPADLTTLHWDGERLFQTARFATEMQYQHLVFEEFGRKVQPLIDVFVFNTITDIDPAIFAEFAHVVYRFGHSMLTEEITRMFLDADGNPVHYDENGNQVAVGNLGDWAQDIGLIEAFLNPVEFDKGGTITHDQAAGAIFRGMTLVHGNEIDEFVVDALRNNLLGLPLDLASINIARGRDTGMPTLNLAREQLYEASGSTFVKPYESWAEFAANLKNPMSVVNFIAAYGTHQSILDAETLEEKRDAAMALVGLSATGTDPVTVANASFETDSLADGQPGVIVDPLGNYTTTAPTGWTIAGGAGGLFDPAVGVTDPSGIDGTNVVWLRQNAVLSQTTGEMLEEGVSYRLTLDVGDRTGMPWPGGEARLVAADNTVLASQVLAAPAEGGWITVTFETGPIAAALAGQGLRIEIQQTDGSSNQILVDDIRLDALRPVTVDLADRTDFLNGRGAYADDLGGLNTVDLWIGGLAEKKMPFGGMLGSTFNAVFEAQLEMLQDLDRFYYLTRTQGLNLLNELENNAFSKMIAANTDMIDPGPDGIRGTADDIESPFRTGVDSFAKHDFVLNVDPTKQIEADPEHDDETLNALGLTKVQRDNLLTAGPDENYLRFIGGEHTVISGTEGNDTIIADFGDDAIWGGAGDDRIEGGAGVDFIIGGTGDDIITDSGDTGDFIKGEDGDDIIANSNGLDVLMGGDGKDVFFVGVDGTEVFGGEGDDFILGGADVDFLMGNEGDDWIEGGDGFDTIAGDNSELFFNSTIIGHDVAFAGENENDFDMESGDDIMVQGESVMRNEGMFGFDWAIHKGNRVAADSDMRIPIFTTVADDILRDRFDQTEALSGWIHNDVLRGDDRGSKEEIEVELDMTNHELTQAGVDRIHGLRELLGDLIPDKNDENIYTPEQLLDLEKQIAFKAGNILIGGDGNDTFEGRGGDDFIHGDAWLNVRIRITAPMLDPDGKVIGSLPNDPIVNNEIATVDTLKHVFTQQQVDAWILALGENPDAAVVANMNSWIGKSLFELMLARTIVPSQMHIHREILYDEDPTDNVDTAIYAGNRDWYEITEFEDGSVRVARREMEEVDPQIDEGTDTLVGIERIQFADQTVVLRQSGNHEPVGRLTLDGLPAREDGMLTVSAANVYDANNPGAGPGNVGNITFRWQIERNDGTGDYINIPGAFGNTFTPNDEHTGLRIRVVGTYIDAGGVMETVMSLPTDVVIGVNDEPVGPVLISDPTPTEGQVLTATIAFTDPDGITDAFEEGLLSYQWQYSENGGTTWINATGEQATPEYTVTSGRVGDLLRVVVRYTDDLGFEHTVNSAPTAIVGDDIDSNAGTINGTAGDDIIDGGGNGNTINGLAGNDIINGGGGSDDIFGGDGNDTIDGGTGNDDDIFGEGGDDTIIYRNGDGSDDIDGGPGNDTLRVLGDDGSNADTMVVTYNGTSIVEVDGSNGDAQLVSIEHVNMDLGAGTDTLSYANTSVGVEVDLLTGSATGFSYIRNIENVTGGSGDDTIHGDNLANVLNGGGGDDTVRGGFGNDSVSGGAGNDRLYGDQGDDILNGGDSTTGVGPSGTIELYDRIDGGAGSDTASYAGAAGAVTVDLSLTAPQNTGGGGNDWLISIENLTGSSNNDTLTGDDRNNVIDGGAGADLMTGGEGDDTYVVSAVGAGGDQVVEDPGGGNDTVRGSVSIDLTAPGLAGQELENIVLTGNSNINATGNNLNNRLTGNSGNNTLNGGIGIDTVVMAGLLTNTAFDFSGGNLRLLTEGTDVLQNIERIEVGGSDYNLIFGNNNANMLNGTSGNDIILGINGDDILNGGAGDDILVGGTGADNMTGGDGNDTYYVDDTSGGSQDSVNEGGGENSGIDTVVLSASGSYTLGANVENLVAIGGGTRTLNGNGLDNDITGGTGNDTINGNGGNDTLRGGAGNDDLNGNAGNDILIGGAGNDDLVGGTGIDTAVFAGPASGYSFSFNGSGSTLTIDDIDNSDGDEDDAALEQMNTGNAIELLQFGNQTYLLNIGSNDDNDIDISGTDPGQAIFGRDGNDTITGGNGHDIIIGGAGNDTLFGSDVGLAGDNDTAGANDNDIFIWHVGDGVDTINGGFEGDAGDMFVVNSTVGGTETFGIYTYEEAVALLGYAGDDEVEILVTRHTGGGSADADDIIAELTDIEEIVINPGGGTNNILFFGDFSLTSLRPNTVTVIGGSGDDTVDLTSLLSAHRVVFKTGGGNDTIVGTLRPQDVIVLPDGMSLGDYDIVQNLDGSTTLVGPNGSVTFFSTGGLPQFELSDDDDDQSNDNDDNNANDDDDNTGNDDEDDDDDNDNDDDDNDDDDNDDDDDDDDDDNDDDSDDQSSTQPGIGTPNADVLIGTNAGDSLIGFAGDDVIIANGGADAVLAGEGNDFVNGGDGNDIITAGAGDDHVFAGGGADIVYGDAGDDRIFAEGGDDIVTGGTGDDVVVGGGGNDWFVATVGDGNDSYFGDEMAGGNGIDTLDMSAITASITANLGTGLNGHGSVSSAQTGNDALWGVENFVGGSGNDSITASAAVNVMDGGGGNDTFHFLSAADADGDTILNFQPGDKLDLSGIDANTGAAGNQAFTIAAGPVTAAAQLMISYEMRDGVEYTVVQGNTGGNDAPEFTLSLKGTHNLSATDFAL